MKINCKHNKVQLKHFKNKIKISTKFKILTTNNNNYSNQSTLYCKMNHKYIEELIQKFKILIMRNYVKKLQNNIKIHLF